jgi:hypothetical protein
MHVDRSAQFVDDGAEGAEGGEKFGGTLRRELRVPERGFARSGGAASR